MVEEIASALVRAMRRCPGRSARAQRRQDAPPWSFTSVCGSLLCPLLCEGTSRPVTRRRRPPQRVSTA
eukprot:4753178-Pyramimonas_sp.AAC.1